MTIRRRDLLAATAGVGVIGGQVLAAEKCTAPIEPKRKAAIKLSCHSWPLGNKPLAKMFELSEKWGFDGLEIGGQGLPGKVDEIKKLMQSSPVKMSAICAGYGGCLISKDEKERATAISDMKEILAATGEVGAVGMVLVPAFNRHNALPNKEARPMLIDKLREVGEYAVKAKTFALLEPLNRKEAFFLRQLADAAAICRDVNHPGVAMMGDFWHMHKEETSELGAFISAGDYLKHVHIAGRKNRIMPRKENPEDNYVLGLKGLKWIGYQGYISFECGVGGDAFKIMPAAAKLIREQWEQA